MTASAFPNRTLGRRSFLTLGAAGAAWLAGCSSNGGSSPSGKFDGKFLIIGAGPAGMSAAHQLQQRGVEYEILEAASAVGGRIKHNLEFTDFPIPLGAEWVHVDAQILSEIVNDPTIDVTTELVGYDSNAQTGYFENGEYTLIENTDFDSDLKFVGSSWLGFFESFILPGIADRITYNAQVVDIDYTGDRIQVTDGVGNQYTADKVVITAPLKVLQRGDITFSPALPEQKRDVINSGTVWSGLKAFIEFDQAFYPAFLYFEDSGTATGQRIYYDAAYGQQSNYNVLGLFSVGTQAERYQALTDDARLEIMLAELDTVFDGQATRSYQKHIVQNWNAEPYAGAAYLADVSSVSISRRLAEPVQNRLFFAGEAYTSFDDWGGVHAATRSAADAVNRILS